MPKVTQPQVVAYVKSSLGYPSVNIEVSDSVIEAHLAVALLFVAPYYSGTVFLEKNFNTVVDLRDDKVEEVVQVYETTSLNSDSFVSGLNFGLANTYNLSVNPIDRAINSYNQAELVSSLGRNFKFIDGRLYVYGYVASTISIECLKTLESVEELRDPVMINYLLEYTLALTKITLGNIRRKFSISSNPVQIDGDAMASDGQSQKSDLESRIKEGNVGIFFVER